MEDTIVSTKIINIAKDFSLYPAGRFKTDGPYSGEAFRDDILVPSLQSHDCVQVQIGEVPGYGSSFLEEAFGGLVRLGLFSKSELKEKLKIDYDEDSYATYADELWDYINAAN